MDLLHPTLKRSNTKCMNDFINGGPIAEPCGTPWLRGTTAGPTPIINAAPNLEVFKEKMPSFVRVALRRPLRLSDQSCAVEYTERT